MPGNSNIIPEKTIERLSEYRRTLLACHRQGVTHIFSHVLAGMHGITAVQVRRDLMLIGFSSDTKKGYDVKVLIDFINNILDSENVMNIGIIGMGVGSSIDDIPCYHMDRFEEVVEAMDISIAVICSPTRVAPSLVVPIINAGIKGVLNFTSAPLSFPHGIVSENYDITTILEKVAYFVKESEERDNKG